MALLDTTRSLLKEVTRSGLSLRKLAMECDGEIEYDWLKRFASGDIKDPSVNRVQALHDCLVSRKSVA